MDSPDRVTVKKGQTAGHCSICSLSWIVCSKSRKISQPGSGRLGTRTQFVGARHNSEQDCLSQFALGLPSSLRNPVLLGRQDGAYATSVSRTRKSSQFFYETSYENRDFEVSSLRPFSAPPVCSVSSRSWWENVTCSSCPQLGDADRLDTVFSCVPRLSASVSSLAVHETLMDILFDEVKRCPIQNIFHLVVCSSLRTLDVFEILASSACHGSQAPHSF